MSIQEQMARLDALLDRRIGEQEDIDRVERARKADAARERTRQNHETKRLIAERYDDAFSAFNVQTPQPADDEAPGAYRRRLFGRLMRRLPDSHELQGIRADDMPSGGAFDNFEAMLLEAAKAEGLRPSYDNLPSDNSMLSRIRTDEATGEKSVNFYGRRSFIADMSRPGQRVARICHPVQGVIYGQPFPKKD